MHTKDCYKINFFVIYFNKHFVCIPILYTCIPGALLLRGIVHVGLVTVMCLHIAWVWEDRHTDRLSQTFLTKRITFKAVSLETVRKAFRWGSIRCPEENHLSVSLSSPRVSFLEY